MERIRSLNNTDEEKLRSLMQEKGLSAEEQSQQLDKLNNIVLLSSVSRLAQSKAIDLSKEDFSLEQNMIDWLSNNFTDEEIAQALFEESRATLEEYLKILKN